MFQKKRTRKNKSKVARKKFRQRQWLRLCAIFQGVLFIAGIALVSLMFIFGHDIITQGHLFQAKRIVVEGNNRLAEKEVLRLAQVTQGMNIFSLNLNVARKRLLSNGWIADADVRRELPDGIHIQIKENEPLAVLDLGKEYILNKAGVIFKKYEAVDKDGLPHVTGLDYSDISIDSCRPSHSMDDFLDLIRVLQRGKKSMSLQTLSRIHVDRDIGLTLYAKGPIKSVIFGFRNFDEKYQRLCVLMSYLEQQKNIHAFSKVDLGNENYIVATPVWEETEPDKSHKEVLGASA